MIVKVCGMREAENIQAVEASGADWLGFIFWPKSSRFVSAVPAYLPTKAKRIGVFVNAGIEEVMQHVKAYGLEAVQLHGTESAEYVRVLKARWAGTIIKAISVSCRDDVATYSDYEGLVDYLLFDTKCKTVGGSGEHFDWTVLTHYVGATPFLLSGGIGPDDAERIRAFLATSGSPAGKCVGIDLNSRFESAPALKDISKLREFIKKIRL